MVYNIMVRPIFQENSWRPILRDPGAVCWVIGRAQIFSQPNWLPFEGEGVVSEDDEDSYSWYPDNRFLIHVRRLGDLYILLVE